VVALLTRPSAVIDVSDAEIHFHADEYIDAAAARRPVIYISPTDIYAMHGIITANMDSVVSPASSHPPRSN
jgi:Ras GTPase-activating-like protein IQGAP2/3